MGEGAGSGGRDCEVPQPGHEEHEGAGHAGHEGAGDAGHEGARARGIVSLTDDATHRAKISQLAEVCTSGTSFAPLASVYSIVPR